MLLGTTLYGGLLGTAQSLAATEVETLAAFEADEMQGVDSVSMALSATPQPSRLEVFQRKFRDLPKRTQRSFRQSLASMKPKEKYELGRTLLRGDILYGTLVVTAILNFLKSGGLHNIWTLHNTNFLYTLSGLVISQDGLPWLSSMFRRPKMAGNPVLPSNPPVLERSIPMLLAGLVNFDIEILTTRVDFGDYFAGLLAISLYGLFDIFFDSRLRREANMNLP